LSAGNCHEYVSAAFVVHALETVVTASAIFLAGVYDAWLRKRLLSIAFVVFQIGYGGLFVSQLASQDRFNTFSQYLYQVIVVIWLAWFCRDFFMGGEGRTGPSGFKFIKPAVAVWAFINGLLAIILSLKHLHLLGRIKGLYFAGNNAWLAQHGVVAGVILLYLSRHLWRGERRARQIFLVIAGLETLKYSVITPSLPLMALYLLTFCGLFVLRDDFDRGIEVITLRMRLKDVLFMFGALLLAALVGLGILLRTRELSDITAQSIDHFFDYTLRSQILPKAQVRSALLAHTISAFLLTGIATILWILFRPYNKLPRTVRNRGNIEILLKRYSKSSEDYFKLWPADKQYFRLAGTDGFMAYKVVGPIAFALADPICAPTQRPQLVEEFVNWARSRRLRACFLPVYEAGLPLYEKAGLNHLQIGASAVVEIDGFLRETSRDKWWRWQKNRAARSGYQYALAEPPHSPELLAGLKKVSDAWLGKDRQERCFAMGYFDKTYLQECPISYLKNADGKIVAFTNHLPVFNPAAVASVDLLRHTPEADNAMPYLLFKTIENIGEAGGYKYFDLGFVPFAAAKGPVITIARALSAGQFSARGLEQFKNKFNPDWQPNFLAYDGDLADLALVAVNLEKAMRLD
jgi:phosphatidylglycerol lysyltransferase